MNARDAGLCESCGAPAGYLFTRFRMELFCETCARRDSNHTRGEAWAATRILGNVIETLRGASCSDDEIRRLVDLLLAHEEPDPDSASVDWQMGGFEYDDRYIPLDQEAS